MKTKRLSIILALCLCTALLLTCTQSVLAEDDLDVERPGKVTVKSFQNSGKNKSTQVTLKWKSLDCDGYQIKLSTSKSFKKNVKTLGASEKKVSKTIKKLKKGKRYYIKIRAYEKEDGNKYYGKWSKRLSCKVVYKLETPKKVTLSAVSSEAKDSGQIKVEWKARKCTGYQVQVSMDKAFIKNNKYTKFGKKITSGYIKGLKPGEKYYVRVRAFNHNGTKYAYGKWSVRKDCSAHQHIYTLIKQDEEKKYYECSCGKEYTQEIEKPKEEEAQRVDPTFSHTTNTKGASPVYCTATNSRGFVYNYTLYNQWSGDLNKNNEYMKKHGCSTCALTTILKAMVPELSGYDPNGILENVIKPIAGKATVNANFNKVMKDQMPISLKGIDKVLDAYDIKHEYVYSYTPESAVEDIRAHLKEGDPVIFMLSKGLYAGGPHAMLMLGLDSEGKVIVGDSQKTKGTGQGKWGKNSYGLLKFSKEGDPNSNTIENIVSYMDGQTGDISSKGFFYSGGKPGNHCYILINPADKDDDAEPDM